MNKGLFLVGGIVVALVVVGLAGSGAISGFSILNFISTTTTSSTTTTTTTSSTTTTTTVCRNVQETYTERVPYIESETYNEIEKYVENETKIVQVPYEVVRKTSWSVDWYSIAGDGTYGGKLNGSTLPSTFDLDWKTGEVFDGRKDWIGFKAKATINVEDPRNISFIIGANNFAELFVDGEELLKDAQLYDYQTFTKSKYITAGKHTLELWFREYTDQARISFNTEADVLTWKETEYREESKAVPVEKERTVQKTRDVVKYRDEQKTKIVVKCE